METQSFVVLAAGMIKTVEDVKRALELPIDEITVGSITWDKKDGNPEPNHYDDGAGNYYNAIGLLNGGEAYYRTHLPEMARMVHAAGRKLIVSISGSSSDENRKLAVMVRQSAGPGVTIELNTACPNVVTGDNQRKPLIGFASELVRNHINAAAAMKDVALRIKVPPYTNMEDLKAIGAVLRELESSANITHVVATNTLPGCLPLDERGNSHIKVGYAGGSGTQLHSLAVGNVKLWRDLMPHSIRVVGVGGVREGRHARNFGHAGAGRVQMAGAYYFGGPKALLDVLMTAL